jgi:hypothetical protein
MKAFWAAVVLSILIGGGSATANPPFAVDATKVNLLDPLDKRLLDRSGHIRFHRRCGGTYWVRDRRFVVQPWQKKQIRDLEDEARRGYKVIACSKHLCGAKLEEKPWAQQVFCFLVDAAVLSVAMTPEPWNELVANNDDSSDSEFQVL